MIPGYIRKTMTALTNAGYECYIVGGAVRDILRGVPVHDYDITTSAEPSETIRVMTDDGFRLIIDSSVRYGTAVFIDPSDKSSRIEITTFRTDSDYADSRHPDNVAFIGSLEEDAARRDFTVNSLYMDVNGCIADPNGGEADIRNKLIRAVGDPGKRFQEDALRILRAVRFESRTGFTIEEKTSEAMRKYRYLLKNISAERIFSEMTGIVTGINGSSAIRNNLEVISVIIPELLIQKDFDQRSKYHDRDLLTHTLDVLDEIPVGEDGKRDALLSYAAIFHDIGKPEVFTVDENGEGHMKKHAAAGVKIAERVCRELKTPLNFKQQLMELVMYHDSYPDATRKSVKRFIALLGYDMCDKLFILQKADVLAHSSIGLERLDTLAGIMEMYGQIRAEQPCLTVKDLRINGHDIMELGVPSGPKIGMILRDVLSLVIDEKLPNDKEAIMSFIKSEYRI